MHSLYLALQASILPTVCLQMPSSIISHEMSRTAALLTDAAAPAPEKVGSGACSLSTAIQLRAEQPPDAQLRRLAVTTCPTMAACELPLHMCRSHLAMATAMRVLEAGAHSLRTSHDAARLLDDALKRCHEALVKVRQSRRQCS